MVITRSSDNPAAYLETLRQITVQMTVARDVAEVLGEITSALMTIGGVALARIWLYRSASDCETCRARGWQEDVANPGFALHLTASAGLYSHVDGTHHRIAVGERKVGEIAATRRPLWTEDLESDPRVPNKEWVRQEGLQSFAGYPLLFRSEVVGVLGVFSRQHITMQQFQSLEVFAAQAATAIKTAELFSRVEGLNDQLQLENRHLQEEHERVIARTAELQRTEAYLVAAQELSHTGSWARRVGTGEGYWSDETFRIFGRDPRDRVPNRQEMLDVWHPADAQLVDRTMEAAAREKRGFELDVRLVRPDRSIRHVHAKGQPIFDAAGNVVEFMGVVMDVTDLKRAERALRRARERTIEARFAAMLAERTRLAREIHDTLLQGFTGVALKLLAASKRVSGQGQTAMDLHELVTLAQQTLKDARQAVWDMRSPMLAEAEFSVALRTAAEEGTRGTGLSLEYETQGPPLPLDREIEVVALRIVQEAIANAVKHAEAHTVRVRCGYEARRMRLSIADDGRGFTVDPSFHAYGGHWGLLGMRERASQIGAKVLVRSTPGEGTKVILVAPYATREAHSRHS